MPVKEADTPEALPHDTLQAARRVFISQQLVLVDGDREGDCLPWVLQALDVQKAGRDFMATFPQNDYLARIYQTQDWYQRVPVRDEFA